MTTRVTIQPSGNPKKKLDAVIEEPGRRAKTVSFGQKGAQDFTTHKDPARKEQYLKRHRAREDWDNPRTAGFWATHLLWNQPAKAASVRDIQRQFPGLTVTLK